MNLRWYNHPVCVVCALVVLASFGTGSAQAAQKAEKTAGTNPASHADRTNALDPELKAALDAAPDASKWPNNHYARILDLGDVTIEADGSTVAEYRETYKLFDKTARQLAEVSLPYNASYQSLRVLSARTIKKDGTIVLVKHEDIRESEPFSDYLMYDDAKTVGFSMPAIEDGCVIDYTYKIITRPLLMPGQFWTYWGFSGPEPVGMCRYVIHAPADKPLKYKTYNNDDLKPLVVVSRNGKTKTYTWEMRNIQPLVLEPSMPNISDVRVWMEVSSLDSWQDIARWFWTLEKPQAIATPGIRETVNKIITGKTSEDDKARAIYDWVANRTRYVGLEFGLSAYRPHPAADVHDKLYGDCKDKATLLITMLGLAGIKAHPVLLHAEERRPVAPGLPTLNAFNHCIALADVGSKQVWLDATAETCAYGDIPDGDRGVEALVVRDGVGTFEKIPTYQPEENGVDMTTKIAVHPDGSAEAQAEIRMRGASGQTMRAYVSQLTPDKRKEVMQQLASRFSVGSTLKDYSLPDGNDKSGPYILSLTLAAPNFAKKTANLLLVPISGGTATDHGSNPFVQDQRIWPIVQEVTSHTRNETTITLPDGFAVDDVPNDVHLLCPLQEYTRTAVKSPDGKTFAVTDIIADHAARVPTSEYAKVKTYYNEVLKTQSDEVVLKKTPKS